MRDLFANAAEIQIRITQNGWIVYAVPPVEWSDGRMMAYDALVFTSASEMGNFISSHAKTLEDLRDKK